MEYYSAIKKNEIMSFAEKEKQLEITTSEVSQKEKDKHHMISLISYVESKTWHKWTYLWNRNRPGT